jgi:PhoP regulatory network protein YrbL
MQRLETKGEQVGGGRGSIILLKTTEPIARGELHDVYQHPDCDDLLIKVPRADRAAARWRPKRRWRSYRRRYGIYTGWLREIRECIAARARHPEHPPSLQRLAGLVETDLGLALVVGKVTGRDGKLAPTLAKKVRASGLTGELREKLAELAAELVARDIVIGDLHERNILCGVDAIGGERLVIIDGIGDKTLIPINTLLRSFNRRSIRRRFDRMIWRLELLDQSRQRPRV